MDGNKAKRLNEALVRLEQQWGSGTVRPLRAISTQIPSTGVSTGFSQLDHLLGSAGIPHGQMTELAGRPTSGMTTLSYQIIARGQADSQHVLYIDPMETFDPAYATRCGVRLDQLFLARPDTEWLALDLVRDLLINGGIGVIALDTGAAATDGVRLRRLSTLLARSNSIFLLMHTLPGTTNPQRLLSNGPSSIRLLVERVEWLDRQHDIRGYRAKVSLLKHPTNSGQSVVINIDFDDNINGEPL